jgi:hypothetical protein
MYWTLALEVCTVRPAKRPYVLGQHRFARSLSVFDVLRFTINFSLAPDRRSADALAGELKQRFSDNVIY